MPLSGTQQGKIGEAEVWKIVTMSSDGQLEVDYPATDDEGRDEEVHERGHFGLSLVLQVKNSMKIYHDRGRKAPLLAIEFRIRKSASLLTHPLYWFLFAYLDPDTMTFRDPIFLIPSSVLVAQLKPYLIKNKTEWHFLFRGNLSPDSKDMWAPYRVNRKDLGPLLLKILRDAEKTAGASLPKQLRKQPGVLRVRRRRRSTHRRLKAA